MLVKSVISALMLQKAKALNLPRGRLEQKRGRAKPSSEWAVCQHQEWKPGLGLGLAIFGRLWKLGPMGSVRDPCRSSSEGYSSLAKPSLPGKETASRSKAKQGIPVGRTQARSTI